MKKLQSTVLYFLTVFLIVASVGCKKDELFEDPYKIDKSKVYLSDLYENSLRDSIWYNFKILSLWQDAIPPNKNRNLKKIDDLQNIRNNYTKYFENSEGVLAFLMSLTNNQRPNRTYQKDFDWYSFMDRGGVISSEIQDNMKSGLGMTVVYLPTKNTNLYIRLVEQGSAAYDAGLKRGDQILSINNDSNIDYTYQKTKNFAPIQQYLQASALTLKVKKVSGEEVDVSIFHKNYNSNPIALNKVIEWEGKKVGYLLLNSFASIRYNGYYTQFYANIESTFNNFQNQGVNELIVDLRNNGGGDVETAEYLANRIGPTSHNGKIMYTYQINDTIKKWGWLNDGEEFADVKFKKRGNLNLSKVYFLVSPNTASASELLINSLSPLMSTYMIGTNSINEKQQTVADKTYGKPVGFFGYYIDGTNVTLYVSSFKMYNSLGQGDYFEGLTPNTNVWEFDDFKDLGNEEETMLATALHHIKTNSFNKASLKGNVQINEGHSISREIIVPNSTPTLPTTGMYKFKKRVDKK